MADDAPGPRGAAVLPSFPAGWFAVAFSRDLAPGRVRRLSFAGERCVLFRTSGGEPVLMGAYCPHLGAHMGYGGRVAGESIECPFHGFRFDAAGACVHTPYEGHVPPAARAAVWPLREANGVVLAWNGPGPPAWEVPPLPDEGWGGLRVRRWVLRGHPQEVTENSVDLGHFATVHGYRDVEVIEPAAAIGPLLTAKYAMTRPRALLGRPVRFEIAVAVHGLGYSTVDVHVPEAGARARLFVLPTPLLGSRIALRVGMQLRERPEPAALGSWLGWLPQTLYGRIIEEFMFRGFASDVSQDFAIWKHKRFVRPPALAAGEGAIGLYRRWARQFYP
jgi:nitrite reductase/ring-hydroxylating ferredoxin subunit